MGEHAGIVISADQFGAAIHSNMPVGGGRSPRAKSTAGRDCKPGLVPGEAAAYEVSAAPAACQKR